MQLRQISTVLPGHVRLTRASQQHPMSALQHLFIRHLVMHYIKPKEFDLALLIAELQRLLEQLAEDIVVCTVLLEDCNQVSL